MCETLNIAHRGARSVAPENTLAAARKAVALGADMWELDVAMTADGGLFLVHDDNLQRTSDAASVFPDREPWENHRLSMAEVRRLDFGSWFVDQDPFEQIAAGKVSAEEQQSFRGEPAPTLRDALEFTRDQNWRVNVEIKDLTGKPGDATVVERVVALVEDLALTDRVLISSFNHRYLVRARRANRSLATGALVSTSEIDPARLLRQLDAQAYHPDVGAIKPEEIRDLRRQGFDVNIWTVNDEQTMRELVAAGASGIITDYPQLLKTILDECQ